MYADNPDVNLAIESDLLPPMFVHCAEKDCSVP